VGTVFATGAQSGNGFVTITFDAANGGCPASAIVVTPEFTG